MLIWSIQGRRAQFVDKTNRSKFSRGRSSEQHQPFNQSESGIAPKKAFFPITRTFKLVPNHRSMHLKKFRKKYSNLTTFTDLREHGRKRILAAQPAPRPRSGRRARLHGLPPRRQIHGQQRHPIRPEDKVSPSSDHAPFQTPLSSEEHETPAITGEVDFLEAGVSFFQRRCTKKEDSAVSSVSYRQRGSGAGPANRRKPPESLIGGVPFDQLWLWKCFNYTWVADGARRS